MLIIGLTGGIGSGKSTVAKEFTKQGIHIVDADQKARDVVSIGKPALKNIESHFGSDILLPDGSLDRAKLRTTIFSDSTQKDWLEKLLHPLIRQDIETDLGNATSEYAILESPLLFETDQHEMVHKTLLVDVPVELQISRGCSRDNNSEEQIQKIIDAQMPRAEKIKRAAFIIDNSSGIAELKEKIEKLHHEFMTL